jgi:hypothetical protein
VEYVKSFFIYTRQNVTGLKRVGRQMVGICRGGSNYHLLLKRGLLVPTFHLGNVKLEHWFFFFFFGADFGNFMIFFKKVKNMKYIFSFK